MNSLVFDDIRPVPRARRSDPITSHAAADGASRFAASHAGRILEALQAGPASAKQIAAATGLTLVQVDRRLPELQRDGFVEVLHEGGVDLVRDGCRVWIATPQKTKPAASTAGL